MNPGLGRDHHYRRYQLVPTMYFIEDTKVQTCKKMTLLDAEFHKYRIIITWLIELNINLLVLNNQILEGLYVEKDLTPSYCCVHI